MGVFNGNIFVPWGEEMDSIGSIRVPFVFLVTNEIKFEKNNFYISIFFIHEDNTTIKWPFNESLVSQKF